MTNTTFKISISTLGCKVNQCDSAAMEESLRNCGYDIAPSGEAADIHIINTCAVTHKTESQSRQAVRRCLKSSPECRVIAIGCYAQKSSEDLEAISERVLVLGNSEKKDIAVHVNALVDSGRAESCVSDIMLEKNFSTPSHSAFLDRTRAFLKVQDGCNSGCTYCIVPSVRGKSRSLPEKEFIARLHVFADQGFGEVVITGIHLGAYGQDLDPRIRISDVLKRLETDQRLADMRVRISSFEPMELSDDLIELIKASARICPHVHIPLQSGDPDILKRMRRPYGPDQFKELTEKLISKIPDMNIGIDVIAGFPGETEQQFENTFDLLKDIPAGYLHVFPYSKRAGTPAAEFDGQVPDAVKKERVKRLLSLSQKKKEAFYSKYFEKTLSVLAEGKRDKKTGELRGFSRNYIPVRFNGDDNFFGKVVPVVIRKVQGDIVTGERF